ncbi:E3 ubiquitin-protein ligase UBR3-like [Watersipora subatra]|uniref:E3 ubiquitin-protein ligase UBR3-like n=1 Tax=Watersipora subatra TaxID=2589382 RepID=UPI00355B5D4F
MSLCPECFNGADHTGHDFNMFRSHAGGACDCGDVNVMKPEGFCTKHGKRETTAKAVPADVTNTARLVISKLITRFVFYLRSKHQEWLSSGGSDTFSLEDGENLLALLHDLSALGVVIRTIISEALNCQESYAKEFLASPDQPDSHTMNLMAIHCQEQYRKAKEELPAPQPKFYGVQVCGRGGDQTVRNHWRCGYECVQSSDGLSLSDTLNHTTALQEILFWAVKYEFPEKITTWLLAILPDENFKEEFTKAFVDHYTRIATSLIKCKGNDQRQRVSNKVVHVSVQLFSNEVYAIRMTAERQLLTRMVVSLYSMLGSNLIQSSVTVLGATASLHRVLDCSNDIIKDHCFWPLISDLVNIMSHKPVALVFMENSLLLDIWFEMVGFLQGMNLNERELMQHVEYETDTYYASFSAEFEISCSPLWRLLLHCTDSSTNSHVVTVLRKIMESLKVWFENSGLSRVPAGSAKVNEYQVSFHLPLHRYFAAFLCTAILHDGFFPKEELSVEFLELLIVHPLQIQVAFYEIFAQMWVRNGLQIRGQAMTYTQCHFCNSLIDLDLYLLQVGCSYLNADYFINTVLKAFHVEHWNLPIEASSSRENIETHQDESMLEGALTTLAMLLCIRTYSGESTSDIMHSEIVTLLCMSDRTYSQLCDSIPEKSGSNNPPADLKLYLQEVADYNAPGFNASGKLQQGTYSPKPEIWLKQFDPLHIMLRTVHRREFQQAMDRYTEFVHNSKTFPQGQTPWPPLRIPDRPLKAYSGLYDMLHSRSLLTFCFNLLHKKLNSKISTVTEPSLYMVIFFMQLIVHEMEPDTQMVGSAMASSWFPYGTVMENLIHTIGTVTVHIPSSRRDKEQRRDTMMDVEETGVEQNIQTMFSSHTNLFGTEMVRLLQMGRDSRSTPGALATPAPVVAVASSSSNTSLSRDVDVTLSESLVSLLMKLHNRLSDKEGSYVPISISKRKPDYSTLVGDGPFFVGRVLDTLSSKSTKCAEAIEKTYEALKPKLEADSNSNSSKKKKKAQDRQKRLLDKMNKMQNKFMDKIEKTMSKEDFEKLTEAELPEDNYIVIEHYECSICSSTTPSTMERPMGMVSLLQSTCVMNFARSEPNAKKLPLADEQPTSSELFSDYYRRAQARLDHMFAGKQDNTAALEADRSIGVFTQSCGHYLHLDCFKAYQESVTVQSRQRQNLTGDEYHCPLCRQLANALLPILPTGSDLPVVVTAPDDTLQCLKDIGAMLNHKPFKWPSEPFYKELNVVTMGMRSNAMGNINKYTQAGNPYEVAQFLISVARCNLDYAVLYETNGISVPSRKSSTAHLLGALSQSILKLHGQGAEALDLLSQLTSVEFHPSASTSSLVLHQGAVPLLLRDPISIFLQLYLRMPPHLSLGYFERLVSAVYNLAFVQALFHVSCKFNEDERQSWVTRGMRKPSFSSDVCQLNDKPGSRRSSDVPYSNRLSISIEASSNRRWSQSTEKVSPGTRMTRSAVVGGRQRGNLSPNSEPPTQHGLADMEQLLQTIITQLTTIRFYPSDDTRVSFLECSVWSPQSIECFVQRRCLSYLEFVAILKKHVYNVPLPERPAGCPNTEISCSEVIHFALQDCQQWFTGLAKYLGLCRAEEISDSPSAQSLDWAGQDSHSIVKGWLNFIMTSKERSTIKSYIMDNRRWYTPRLLELPTQYDAIFQFYRKMKCPLCKRPPVSPSICLICGAFVCFKEVCCVSQSGVAHSKACGSGTSVVLDINASIVAIIRGKRATLWGSVYLDEHGEEDRDLKRGRPLYLCKERYQMLEQQWLSHNFDYVCKRWIFHSDQL